MELEIYVTTLQMIKKYLGNQVSKLFEKEYLEYLENMEYERTLESNFDIENSDDNNEAASQIVFYLFFVEFIKTYYIDFPNICNKIDTILNQQNPNSRVTRIMIDGEVIHLENFRNSNNKEDLNENLNIIREEIRGYEQRFN
ncbi:hypothetical protein JZO78_09470 [Enterococcus ureilyticus]|uniref:hypothetical protein n=1 Tax=Enterococcus ureilyticus TaxID=1131292 RepID=UPI001A92B9CB|nr:hypothetical protein [Enterococcus ureilyticus]MBO0446574.1 hypothetical protein [Enterococcus ureilyticus]